MQRISRVLRAVLGICVVPVACSTGKPAAATNASDSGTTSAGSAATAGSSGAAGTGGKAGSGGAAGTGGKAGTGGNAGTGVTTTTRDASAPDAAGAPDASRTANADDATIPAYDFIGFDDRGFVNTLLNPTGTLSVVPGVTTLHAVQGGPARTATLAFKGNKPGTYDCSTSSPENYLDYTVENEDHKAMNGQGNCSMVVTAYGAVGEPISGTFSGRLFGVGIIDITQGQFHVTRGPDM